MWRGCLPSRHAGRAGLVAILLTILALAGCAPSPQANVAGYFLARRLGNLTPAPVTATGDVTGLVLADGRPLAGATVIVAERTGTPHTAQTDATGRYRLRGVPPGQYVPAAVAPDYDEVAAADVLGIPRLVTVVADQTATAPVLHLTRHVATPLPQPLATAVQLTQTRAYTATAPFPANAVAQVYAYQYVADGGLLIDSLRVYLPLNLPADHTVPLLFMVYPTPVDDWEAVSVAFAAAGYGMVAHLAASRPAAWTSTPTPKTPASRSRWRARATCTPRWRKAMRSFSAAALAAPSCTVCCATNAATSPPG